MPIAKERVSELSGKRVHLETTEFHHLVGMLEGRRDDLLVLKVRGREVCVQFSAVSSLEEANQHEAEYVK